MRGKLPLNRVAVVIESRDGVLGSSGSAVCLLSTLLELCAGMFTNISGCEVIVSDTPSVNSFTCRRRYRRKASLFQRPSSMMVDVRTWAKYSSMAQLDRTVCVPTWQGFTPKRSLPILYTVVRIKSRI